MSYYDILLAKQLSGGGGDITVESLSVTANGTYTAPSGKAYTPVSVAVPQPTGTKSITTNGTHDVTDYASASVAVPNSYDASDEGKVVSSGALVAQTSQTIDTNGTYDTTLKDEIVVNVSGGGGSPIVGALRPDAELVQKWAVDSNLVSDLGVSLGAYSTSSRTLYQIASLTKNVDSTTYGYQLVKRGLIIPIYNDDTDSVGKSHYSFFHTVCELFNAPITMLDGSTPSIGSAVHKRTLVTTSTEFYKCFHDTSGNYVNQNQAYGLAVTDNSNTWTAATDTISIGVPIVKVRGSSSEMSETWWGRMTDIRYQYVIELYQVPLNQTVSGFIAQSQLKHINDCIISPTHTLT